MIFDTSLMLKEIGCIVDVMGFQVLLKAPEIPETTRGGVIIPSDSRKASQREENIGQVIGFGPEAFNEKKGFGYLRCEIGDWVQYTNYSRTPTYPNGMLCYYISDEHLLAKIPKESIDSFLRPMELKHKV